MKTRINGKYIFFAILSILIITVSCTNNENNLPTPEENNPPIPEEKNILFLKSALGGCNGNRAIEETEEKEDTVVINLSNDTLHIFAGLNYICCAPFISDCEIINDSIFISITDTCPNPYRECYCRCDCYYTFDYYFEEIGSKNYYWQIVLIDPREEDQILFNSGEYGVVKTEN